MAAVLLDSYGDLLGALEPERRVHSLAVGRKAEAEASRVPAALRSDLVAAAVLHDIGYAYQVTGFPPLDGARILEGLGFSRRVCHLVVHHSGSTWEAEERGLELAVYNNFAVKGRRYGAGACGAVGGGHNDGPEW